MKNNLEETLAMACEESGPLSRADLASLAHWLARQGLGAGLRFLALRGELSDEVDEHGMNVLAWSARGDDEECVMLAGEACAPGALDVWGGNALHHWAQGRGRPGPRPGAQMLLALGVDPGLRDSWGMLPMHWSADSGVWAWSLLALWAKGDSDGWKTCGGRSSEEAMEWVGVTGLQDWAKKMKWDSGRRARRGLSAPEVVPEPASEALDRLAARSKAIDQSRARQNCIAHRLGIELFAQ
jgi:hypothetical protein